VVVEVGPRWCTLTASALPSPCRPEASPRRATSWRATAPLTLAPGWKLATGEREGDMTVAPEPR